MLTIFGVSSATPINKKLKNSYKKCDCVNRRKCYPGFCMKTLWGEDKITAVEIEFFKNEGCKRGLVIRDLAEAKTSAVKDTGNDLSMARAIFDNMGVVLPQGNIEAVYETIKSDNFMGWKSCTLQEAQAAADKGFAAIGISEEKIFVLFANDGVQPATQTGSVMTISETPSVYAVDELGYYSDSYGTATQGDCTRRSICNYNDTYTCELVKTFGFTSEVATLIRSLYDRVDGLFFAETYSQRAWKCSRLLGGLVYGNDSYGSKAEFKWKDITGQVNLIEESAYFVNVLGYTYSEYLKMKNAIISQYKDPTTPNFAHMQMSLSTRLANKLFLEGFKANIGTFSSDENVAFLAGWFGDATITNDHGNTSFGNDDYCADLDAENIYRIIIQGYSSVNAINSYYSELSMCHNRADVFLKYISYNAVKHKVFYELIDEDLFKLKYAALQNTCFDLAEYYSNLINDETYHWVTMKSRYPDTYNFLKSLQNRSANITHFRKEIPYVQ